ncbi:MAG: T9SS type A sorting domain-containing protein [Bacteroidetes bacterium]|nr:T9SS type A sorting domain-containing protein [Bacteroidota bacterium]
MRLILTVTILFSLLVLSNGLFAQCPPNNITTNPDNTVWNNPPYNTLYKQNTGTNKFDWRTQRFNLSMPGSAAYHGLSSLLSPFYFGLDATNLANIVAFPDNNGVANDFNPEDGWELIKRDFGYNPDGSTNTNESLVGPYFILYNKFTGTFRVFGYLASANGDFQTVNVKLGFPANQNVTGIFSYYNQIAQPLDVPSAKLYASTPAALPAVPERPFFADFKIAYDPCTCNSQTNLTVTFEKVQQMDITMYGRVLATSSPVDYLVNTSTNTYDFSKYLTSVYNLGNTNNSTTDYTLTAGLMTYSSINQMISDYIASADATANSGFLKDGFDILGKALSVASTFTPANKDKIKNALDAASTISDFLSGRFGSTTASLPSVIQGEMSLVGHIQNKVDQYYSIPIANPGSVGSDSAPVCCSGSYYYPLYNEVLGVFALLSTPQVSVKYDFFDVDPYHTGADRYVKSQYKLSAPLQYVFNPAAKVNLANSRVYASFEIETAGANSVNWINLFQRYTTTKNGIGFSKFTTSPVPVESLSSFTFEFDGLKPTAKPTLSLLLDLEFQDLNKSGVPNKALYVLTFPVNIASSTLGTAAFPSYSENLTVSTANYATTTNLSAWKDVTVTGNLTTSNGAIATFNTGGNSILNPGSSIGPGIVMEGGNYPFPVNYAVVPQSTAAVNAFCTSATYKANTPAASAKKGTNSIENLESAPEYKFMQASVYPNPAQNKVSFQYTLDEASNVKLVIQDLTGQVISVVTDSYQEAGAYNLNFETSVLPNGMYIYTLETNSGKVSKRLLIAK